MTALPDRRKNGMNINETIRILQETAEELGTPHRQILLKQAENLNQIIKQINEEEEEWMESNYNNQSRRSGALTAIENIKEIIGMEAEQ